MKLTNGEIFEASRPMAALLEEKLPVKTSYKLTKLALGLEEQLQVIEKVRHKLIETYGEKDPENSQQTRVSRSSKGYAEFAKELTILMTQEVEVEFDPVELPDTLEIAPSALMALRRFVSVGETN